MASTHEQLLLSHVSMVKNCLNVETRVQCRAQKDPNEKGMEPTWVLLTGDPRRGSWGP